MANQRRTTMEDVAEHAQVSIMTVSRVLNRNSRVSDSARSKVLKAVEELNYKPNLFARNLASSRSHIIGILYDNPSPSYVSKFLIGAMNSCRSNGYHLVIDECRGSTEHSLDLIYRLINDTQVDGIILLPPVSNSLESIAIFQENKIPVVRIAPDINLDESHYICMDDYRAAFDMTNHLIESGHTKIGFIMGHQNQGVSRFRYQGYVDALKSYKVIVPKNYIEQGYYDYRSGLEAAEKLLSLDEKPTAIFASNDDMAAAVVAVAHKHNLDVPNDIAVAGFDDTAIANIIWPPLTTIQQPLEQMAEAAIRILVENYTQDEKKSSASDFRHILDYKLITRESTSKPS